MVGSFQKGEGGTRRVGRRPVTMLDLAMLAGVSAATVSRHLRGERVRHADRIAAAVAELDYRRNETAQNLRGQRTHSIAVVQRDLTNPYLAAVVQGVHSVAVKHRYAIYVAEGVSGDANVPEPADTIFDLSSRVDGFIYSALTDGDMALEALQASGLPVVLIESEPREAGHEFDVVVVDDEGAAREAAEYLLSLGHKRLAVIAGPQDTSPGRTRLRGFQAALGAAGLSLDERYLEVADFSWAGGYQATARLLGGSPPPTAIFGANNLMALGCLHCLHDLGIRIPNDISFVGFDPLVSSELFSPPPTLVSRPASEQGALAMRLLDNRMMGKADGPPRRIVLSAELVLRGSCAPPSS